MILQPLTRHPRRKTIIKVGLFVLKISFFLPFSLLAQTQAAAFTPALIAFPPLPPCKRSANTVLILGSLPTTFFDHE